MRILLTGGAGFVGTNLTRYLLDKYPDYTVVSLASTRSAHSRKNVQHVSAYRNYRHVEGRLEDEAVLQAVFQQGIDVVIHLAAQSHVDQSAARPGETVAINVLGTQRLLDAARSQGVKRFVQISSSEVYGPIEAEQVVSESSCLAPVSLYAASKASSDLLALAYHQTFGLDVVVTRCTNNYGPLQLPDKLIPKVITQALCSEPIPLFGDGNQMRNWLHVYDHCTALDAILHRGTAGSIYNITSDTLATTREIVEQVLGLLDRPLSLIEHLPDRPGQQNRFAPSGEKLRRELGWQPTYDLAQGLQETVAWYQQQVNWWSSQSQAHIPQ